jgi:hypothetical protein
MTPAVPGSAEPGAEPGTAGATTDSIWIIATRAGRLVW